MERAVLEDGGYDGVYVQVTLFIRFLPGLYCMFEDRSLMMIYLQAISRIRAGYGRRQGFEIVHSLRMCFALFEGLHPFQTGFSSRYSPSPFFTGFHVRARLLLGV